MNDETSSRSDTPLRNLKAIALRGAMVRVAAQAATFAVRIASIVILARLLEPADFGLVGMVTVITGVFNLFKDAGLSLIAVQRESITDDQLSGLFWLNVLVGAALAGISAAMAPGLVSFYGEPRLFWVSVVLGLGFLFNALGVQHTALLQRRMRFMTLAIVDIAALLLSVAVGLIGAIAGYGYWALVGMAICLPTVSSAGAWLTAGWSPRWPKRGIGLMSMMRFGGVVSLNGLIVYCAYNADKLLIGRFWGAETLGVYGRAYQLINIPTENLQGAVGGVVLAALSRLQSDAERFKSYFLKGYALFLTMSFPITLVCGLFADDIVFVLLGGKWESAAPIFRFLSPTILAFALINPLTWLLFATGRITRSLKMALVITPLVIASYATGLLYGPTGVAIGFSGMMMLLTVPLLIWATHDSIVSPRELWQSAKQPFVAAVVSTVLVLPLAYWLRGVMTPLPRLIVETGVLLTSYGLVLFYPLRQKAFYLDLVESLMRPQP